MTNELKPWLDQEVPLELRRLLVAARMQEPELDDVHRVMTQLALTKASSGSSASIELSAGGATGSAIVGTKWAILGGGLAGVLAVGIAIVGGQRPSTPSDVASGAGPSAIERVGSVPPLDRTQANAALRQPSQSARASTPNPTITPSRPAARRARISAGSAWSDETAPVEVPSIQSTEIAARAVLAPRPAPSEPPKESQSAFVDRARDALKRGWPGETLRILDRYDHAYRTRTFDPEALQLRMRAHTRLGNSAAAHQAAETLVAHYPSTPQGKEATEFLGR